MDTLILNGSPRSSGDTAALIKAFTDKLTGGYEVIDCYTADIAPCTDCRCCRERLFCPKDDEMQHIYRRLTECGSVVIASPVHYGELSAMLLKAAGRFQIYSSALIFRHEVLPVKAKLGGVILTQGGSGGAERAFKTAELIFQSIGIKEVLPPVYSLSTDSLPAAQDDKAIAAASALAQKINSLT